MPLRINGHQLPWSIVTSAIVFTFWLGGLSFAVKANTDEIEKSSSTDERLARIEEKQESFKEDVAEIKDEQKTHSALLVQVLTEVRKDNDDSDE